MQCWSFSVKSHRSYSEISLHLWNHSILEDLCPVNSMNCLQNKWKGLKCLYPLATWCDKSCFKLVKKGSDDRQKSWCHKKFKLRETVTLTLSDLLCLDRIFEFIVGYCWESVIAVWQTCSALEQWIDVYCWHLHSGKNISWTVKQK